MKTMEQPFLTIFFCQMIFVHHTELADACMGMNFEFYVTTWCVYVVLSLFGLVIFLFPCLHACKCMALSHNFWEFFLAHLIDSCTTKKDTSVTFWVERIFFLSYIWHFYDDNCDKTRYHHRCGGGLLLLWQKIMTENGLFVLGGP